MQFLRTLFWVILAVVLTLFGYNNWVPVTVRLWGDIVVDSWLALVMAACFLAGALPVWLFFSAARWRLRRQLAQTERSLAHFEAGIAGSGPLADADTDAESETVSPFRPSLAPGAAPIAPPPGSV